MKPTKTGLVDLYKDKHPDPRFSVCYARGRVFKKEGPQELRVELGMRSVVSKALCATGFYADRCEICPNSQGIVTLKARGKIST